MRQEEVPVSREDIAKGVRGDKNFCPIAQAFIRKFPESDPIVTRRMVEFSLDGFRFNIGLKNTGMDMMIERFDKKGKMVPFTFRFPILESCDVPNYHNPSSEDYVR